MLNKKEKIFVIGFPKTGTTSIESVLTKLKYSVCGGHWKNNYTNYLQCCYINGDTEELIRITDYWDVFSDTPWGGTNLYHILDKKYPEAKFILTRREPEAWLDSLLNMILQYDDNRKTALDTYHATGRFGFPNFLKHRFQIETLEDCESKILDEYNRFNIEVIEYFYNREGKLLVLDIEQENKLESLCSFLNVPVLNNFVYPQINKRNSLNEEPKCKKTRIVKLKERLKKVINF